MNITKKMLVAFIFFLINVNLTYALSVDNNELTLTRGENSTVDVYADLKEDTASVSFSLVFTTYDVPATFKENKGFKNELSGTKNTISFTKLQKGKIKLGTIKIDVSKDARANSGTIKLTNAIASASSGKVIKLNPIEITVIVNKNSNEDKAKESNLLKEIKSDIVTIGLKDNVYMYEVNLLEEVEELDLQAIPKDEKSKVSISNQKINDLKDGKIIITVTSASNTREEYTIKVNVLKTEKVEIDREKFEADTSYKRKWIVVIIVSTMVLGIGFVLNRKKG